MSSKKCPECQKISAKTNVCECGHVFSTGKETEIKSTYDWYAPVTLTAEQKKAQSEKETASWLVTMRARYPEKYELCKSEISLYRKDPVSYKQAAMKKVKDAVKSLVIDYDDIPF